MNLTSIFATCCVLGLATGAVAQELEFTHYLGSFPAANLPLPITADADGKLYYATFNAGQSQFWIVEDPEAAIGSETIAGKHVKTFPQIINQRGFQGIQVASDGKVFLSADNANTSNLIFRFDPVVVNGETTYTEVTSFTTNGQANGARKLGMALISETGNGLLAVNSLTDVRYHDFTGQQVGAPVALPQGNTREVVWNPTNNVIYPLRNGRSTSVSLEAVITGVNTTTGGGTAVTGINIPGADGALNGVPYSHGYYYAEQEQLITVGQIHAGGGTTTPATIRVWDVIDNGTSLSLAYEVDSSHGKAGFIKVGDAVVSNNRLYVTSETPEPRIHVYQGVPASVNRWDEYESSK